MFGKFALSIILDSSVSCLFVLGPPDATQIISPDDRHAGPCHEFYLDVVFPIQTSR